MRGSHESANEQPHQIIIKEHNVGMEKRRDVLNYIKQKNCSIYFLQDTHFTADDYVNNRYGGMMFISPRVLQMPEAQPYFLTITLNIKS